MSVKRRLKRHKATGIPIFDRLSLAEAPLGHEIHTERGVWRKNDENELITRKEARQQVQATINAMSADMMTFFEHSRTQNQEADKAIWREDAEKRCIFTSLLFVGDPLWEAGIETLRTRYHNVASKALDEVRKLRTLWEGDAEMIAAFMHLENLLTTSSSAMSEALRKAIAQGDKGAALKELSETMSMSVSDELDELLGETRTEGIARDRSWDRGTVWIGWQCNKMERTQQTLKIETMWKTLHRRLLSKQKVWGDEEAALRWLTDHANDNPEQVRKEVSRFKQQIKPYYDQRAALDKTLDARP